MRSWLVGFTVTMLFVSSCYAIEEVTEVQSWSKKEKLIALNVSAYTTIGLWGIATWQYGQRDPHITSEGWFGENTKHGGADKIGHAYANYMSTHLLAHTYQDWGYAKNPAALYAAISSVGLYGFMEVGDAFSEFGFSAQDFAMNIVGSAFGYASYRNDTITQFVDLRVEYIPTFTKYDVFTDYQGLKYLVAFKLGALSYKWTGFELQSGYFVRGYETLRGDSKQRVAYVAIGVNLFDLIERVTTWKPKVISRYVQLPYTYASYRNNLNNK